MFEQPDSALSELVTGYLALSPVQQGQFWAAVSPGPASKRVLKQEAVEVLQRLNDLAGKRYRIMDSKGQPSVHLRDIMHRLESGISKGELLAITVRKCREWKGTDMDYCLRPATLYNKTKCENYLGELG